MTAGGTRRRADLGGQVLGQSRLGVRLVSVLAVPAQSARLPLRTIQRAAWRPSRACSLSAGGIVEALHRLGTVVAPAEEALRSSAGQSEHAYGRDRLARKGPERLRLGPGHRRTQGGALLRPMIAAGRGWSPAAC